MIVISILTALGLEQAFEAIHHRHLAHQASASIEVELDDNVKEINTVIAHNQHDIEQIDTVRTALRKAIRAKVDDAVLLARFDNEWKSALVLGIRIPALRHEAWDAAVASQAVTWMPADRLQHYATVYANIRDVHVLTTTSSMFLDGPRYMDTVSNYQLGVATPSDVYRALTQVQSAYGSVDGNLKGLLKELGPSGKPDTPTH